MNYTKIGKVLILILINFVSLNAESLNTYFELNRFWDTNHNTIFNINYKIAYPDLKFVKQDKGYLAKVKVEYAFYKEGKEVLSDSFVNNLPANTKEQTKLLYYAFLDQISVTLKNDGYRIKVKTTDMNNENAITWEKDLPLLKQEFSDIEFSSKIIDSKDINAKFYRYGKIFKSVPQHIFYEKSSEFVYLYFESKNVLDNVQLQIKTDNKKIQIEETKQMSNGFLISMKLDQFAEGYHPLQIELETEDMKKSIDTYITVVSNDIQKDRIHMFDNLADELQLMEILSFKNLSKNWKIMSKEAQRRAVHYFWVSYEKRNNSANNSFFKMIQDRIKYCNDNFYSKNEVGWKTDRARIYLRYGKPTEILKGTSDQTNLFGNLDVVVWKYRTNGLHSTYVFIDRSHNDSFPIIIADGDDFELTNTNASSYFGVELNRESRMSNANETEQGWISTQGTFDSTIFD